MHDGPPAQPEPGAILAPIGRVVATKGPGGRSRLLDTRCARRVDGTTVHGAASAIASKQKPSIL